MKLEQETTRTLLCVVPGCSFRPVKVKDEAEAESLAIEHLSGDPTHYLQVNSVTFIKKDDDPATAA